MVLTEAMSCGLPVVSYACPYGPDEIVSDNVDGFLVPVGDEEGLTDRINYLIEQEAVRKTMCRATLQKSKQYEVGRSSEKWLALFQELIEEKRKRVAGKR